MLNDTVPQIQPATQQTSCLSVVRFLLMLRAKRTGSGLLLSDIFGDRKTYDRERNKAWSKSPEGKANLASPEKKSRQKVSQKKYSETERCKGLAKKWHDAWMNTEEGRKRSSINNENFRFSEKRKDYFKSEKGIISKLNSEHLRRAKKLTNGQHDKKINYDLLWKQCKYICAYCGGMMNRYGLVTRKEKRSLDHIIPLSKGGAHTHSNFQLLHRGCNSQKSNKII